MKAAAELLKNARREVGLTQTELAQRIGVSQPVVARLEREGANPRLKTLEKAIAATGHSLALALADRPSIDETMIIADLKLTPDQRLRQFQQAYAFAKRIGGAAVRGP